MALKGEKTDILAIDSRQAILIRLQISGYPDAAGSKRTYRPRPGGGAPYENRNIERGNIMSKIKNEWPTESREAMLYRRTLAAAAKKSALDRKSVV